MALNLEQKKAMVQEVASVAQDAQAAIAAEYRGLTAGQMDELRAKAREQGVYLRVVKNTLMRRAVEGTPFECMKEEFTGPLLMAFSQEEPGSAARVLRDFGKQSDKLVVKLVALQGRMLQAGDVERLASMPTRDEAISQFMATMRAPVQKLATTLNEVPSKFVRTLAAVRDAKQG